MYPLTYICLNVFLRFSIQRKNFFRIFINFLKGSGIPVTVTATVSVTVMSFEVHRSSGGLWTYIGTTKKKFEQKS